MSTKSWIKKYSPQDFVEVQCALNETWQMALVYQINQNYVTVNLELYEDEKTPNYREIHKETDIRYPINCKEEMKSYENYKLCAIALQQMNPNLILIKTNADGNCGPKSISISQIGIDSNHLEIRQKCYNFIQKNKQYGYFMTETEREKIKNTGEFVNRTFMSVISHLFQFNINMYKEIAPAKFIIEKIGGLNDQNNQLPMINIAYHEKKKHFNFIFDTATMKQSICNLAIVGKNVAKNIYTELPSNLLCPFCISSNMWRETVLFNLNQCSYGIDCLTNKLLQTSYLSHHTYIQLFKQLKCILYRCQCTNAHKICKLCTIQLWNSGLLYIYIYNKK